MINIAHVCNGVGENIHMRACLYVVVYSTDVHMIDIAHVYVMVWGEHLYACMFICGSMSVVLAFM